MFPKGYGVYEVDFLEVLKGFRLYDFLLVFDSF